MSKSMIKKALIEAKELEIASMGAAQDIIIQEFAPKLRDFYKDILSESEDMEDELDDDELDDDELEEDNEHDMGKIKDSGKQGTDPAIDDKDEDKPESLKEDDDEDEESMSNDVSDDETDNDSLDIPDELFDDEDESDDLGDDDLEEEFDLDDLEDDEDELDEEFSLDDIKGDDEDDEELGEEFNLDDIKGDDEDDEELDEELDFDIEDEDEPKDGLDEKEAYDDDELEKDPSYVGESLKLRQQNRQLRKLVKRLTGQIQETNLFNAKLAHVNKLYMSGVFTNEEKESIAERLDECDEVSSVKKVYKKIIKEVNSKNPLDDFSARMKDIKSRKRNSENNDVYKSAEMGRLLEIAGIKK